MAKDLARIYTKEIFIRHRLLVKIISDRDLKFVGNLYSGTRNLYSNVNSILSINGRIDRKAKLDTRIVSKILY